MTLLIATGLVLCMVMATQSTLEAMAAAAAAGDWVQSVCATVSGGRFTSESNNQPPGHRTLKPGQVVQQAGQVPTAGWAGQPCMPQKQQQVLGRDVNDERAWGALF